jgi:glycosyltransferase involved in cell wall biosynthesis
LEDTLIPFKIVGEMDNHSRLLKEAENKGLDRVEFTGFKTGSELSEIISGAKFIVVPSRWYEVFGLVILEAYAHGKPVIASRMGGIPEVVEEGETGYLFDSDRPEALREKMIDLYENNEKTIAMGKSGRARAESLYNPALHYSRLMEIYSSLS